MVLGQKVSNMEKKERENESTKPFAKINSS